MSAELDGCSPRTFAEQPPLDLDMGARFHGRAVLGVTAISLKVWQPPLL